MGRKPVCPLRKSSLHPAPLLECNSESRSARESPPHDNFTVFRLEIGNVGTLDKPNYKRRLCG
jgi:hypothetical protein